MRCLAGLFVALLLAPIAAAADSPLPAPLNAATNYVPRWSPDGQRLAFASTVDGNWNVHVVDADGSNLERLTDHPAADVGPEWSPDGRELVFFSRRDGNAEIYLLDLATRAVRRLTDHLERDGNPSFSPDGRHIVFVSDRGGTREIWRMDRDGGGLVQLTHGSVDNTAARPIYSPDGRSILFASQRPGDAARKLWIMDADGSRLREFSGHLLESNPSYTPDGAWVAYDGSSTGRDDTSDGSWEIFRRRADGSEETRLTRNRVNDWAPHYSPDGRFIAYCSGFNDQYEIWVMNADGTAPRRVTRLVYPE